MRRWTVTNREGRLHAVSEWLTGYGEYPALQHLRRKINAALKKPRPEDHVDQFQFAQELRQLATKLDLPVDGPWTKLEGLRDTMDAERRRRALPGSKPLMDFVRRKNHEPVVENVSYALQIFDAAPTDEAKIHVGIFGILNLWELLHEQLAEAFAPVTKKTSEAYLGMRGRVLELVDLRWLEDLPITLDRLRQAIAHGKAVIRDDRLVILADDYRTVDVSLTAKNLRGFLIAGRFVWDAFIMDMILLQCWATVPQRVKEQARQAALAESARR